MGQMFGEFIPPQTTLSHLKTGTNIGVTGLVKPWEDALPGVVDLYHGKGNAAQVLNEWVDMLAGSETLEVMPLQLIYEPAKWAIMSMLQKSIRRSREDWAQIAVSAMANSNMMGTVWSRLGVICLEDLGLGGIPALATVCAIQSGNVKIPEGLEVDVAMSVVKMMIHAVKDRSACDVASITMGQGERMLTLREELAGKLPVELACVMADRDQPIIARVLAHKSLVGKMKQEPYGLQLQAAYDAMGTPNIVRYCVTGYKSQHKDLMWAGLPVLWDVAVQSEVGVDTHDVSDYTDVLGIPSCCYDMFTSDGKRAMAYFRKACEPVLEFFGDKTEWQDQMGYAVFAAEGGNLDRSVSYEQRDHVAYEALTEEFLSVDLTMDRAAEISHLVAENLDGLNKARKRVIEKSPITGFPE